MVQGLDNQADRRGVAEAARSVVRLAVGVRHGHPVLFDRSLFDELRKAPLDQARAPSCTRMPIAS